MKKEKKMWINRIVVVSIITVLLLLFMFIGIKIGEKNKMFAKIDFYVTLMPTNSKTIRFIDEEDQEVGSVTFSKVITIELRKINK
jgi:hypothetical protein